MNTITGYFGGTMWNESTRKFDIKTLGEKDNGAILCGLNVSSKDKDGNRVYGKPVDVKINIKSADEGKRVYELIASGDSMLSMEGFFVANNWTNKEGKEIRGNQYLVTDSTKVVKANSAPKQAPKKEPESEPWDA
jgi:hypothetical protein